MTEVIEVIEATEVKRKTETYEKNDKPYERKFENKAKGEKHPTKITIAPSEETVKSQAAPSVQKPKSNPFGEAKPVDTLNKELEFQKRFDTEKKPAAEEDQQAPHEKRYVKKEHRENEYRDLEKSEVKETPEKVETKDHQESSKPVEPVEHKEQREDHRKEEEEPKSEHKPHDNEDSYNRPQSGRGGRGNRRGYRKKNDNRPERNDRRNDHNDEYRGEGKEVNDNWGAEHTENYEERDKRKNYDGGYTKRGYDDRKRGDRGDRGKPYNERKFNRNYEEKKHDEEGGYVKHFENRNKEPRPNAWGNPEQAAEILKKPKEVKPIQEEEKQTKKGTSYIKKTLKDTD